MALCTKGTQDEASVSAGEKPQSAMIIPLPRGGKKTLLCPGGYSEKEKGLQQFSLEQSP